MAGDCEQTKKNAVNGWSGSTLVNCHNVWDMITHNMRTVDTEIKKACVYTVLKKKTKKRETLLQL